VPPAPWVPRVGYLGEHVQQPFADRHGFRLPIASAHSVSSQPASTAWVLPDTSQEHQPAQSRYNADRLIQNPPGPCCRRRHGRNYERGSAKRLSP